jgi:acetate kinase
VQYLARSASFHSDDEIAPSKFGIKHLARQGASLAAMKHGESVNSQWAHIQ